MGTQSLYVDVDDDVLRPRTDTPCADAPQQGIHLFHYPKSLCSQKVRQLLDEKGVAWTSHVVQLPLEAQYEPAYVRINPRCVVPTLVRDGKVTTDSMNILRFADAALPGPALTPASASARACVDRFLASADGLFLEVLTYGEIPGVRKPLLMRQAAKGTHAEKLARLDAKLREHGDDPRLRAAYVAKRRLVEETSESMRDPAATAAIVEATAERIAEVADQLEAGPFTADGWLCGDAFSLADLEWGIVLYRLRWLGLAGRLWGSRPVIERYAARLFARPAFKSAVLGWDRPLRDLILPLVAARLRAALGR